MRSWKGERGAVSMGLIVVIFLALFLIYELKQFGPLLIAQYEFQDAVVEAAKFSRGKEAAVVQSEVVEKADELALPITRDMVKVTRQNTNTRIQVNYQLKAQWAPGKEYKWNVEVDEESRLF
jgi:hypothetical protein